MSDNPDKMDIFVKFIQRTDATVWAGCVDEVVGLLDDLEWDLEKAVDSYLSFNFGEDYHNNPEYHKLVKKIAPFLNKPKDTFGSGLYIIPLIPVL